MQGYNRKDPFFYLFLNAFIIELYQMKGVMGDVGVLEAGKSVRIKYEYIHIEPIQTFSS